MRVFLDTGVFLNILNKESGYKSSVKLLEKIQDKKVEGFLSVITFAEMFSIYYRISKEKTNSAKNFVQSITGEENIVPVIRSIAELAGKIKAEYKVSLGDALIISTSIKIGCDYLVSFDPEIKNVGLVKVREPSELA